MSKKFYILIFLILLFSYIALVFTLPTDPEVLEKYSLSQSNVTLLNLSVVLPISAIYLTALYGFIKFKEYTDAVIKTKEGPYFHKISIGLMFLAFSLPINSILSALVNYSEFHNVELFPALSILQNYTTIILALIAVIFVSLGAEGLYKSLNKGEYNAKYYSKLSLLGPIIIASLYTLLITSQSNVQESVDEYNMPSWLIILTIAIPYVYLWSVGIKAVFQFHSYKKSVKGKIYKSAFSYLSKGFAVVIAVSVLIQVLTSLGDKISRLNLTPLLAVVYLLIILYAVGYAYIAVGAKKLTKIEKV